MKTAVRECAWCGRQFEADARNNHKNVLCSDECRRKYKQAYRQGRKELTHNFKITHKEDGYVQKMTHAEKVRREKHQADTSIWNAGYAERQKQKTLELIGRVKT